MQSDTPTPQDAPGQEAADKVVEAFQSLSPIYQWAIWAGVFVVLFAALIWLGWYFFGREKQYTRFQLRVRGAVIVVAFILSVLGLILGLPVSSDLKSDLISLFGLSIAALITLGSTTIFANFMAGVMMYHVRSFRPGDYIRVNDHSGRVTAKGVFHVEIQTEDRDLMTLPNAYLITNPVRVVRASGTIIACEVSLGYDTPHARVKELLLKAIESAGLAEGFVQVRDLGDFSVTYRACGLLEDTKKLVSMRTALRTNVLDALHEGGVEIVSPNFVNRREVPGPVIPERVRKKVEQASASPEEIIFDKAEDAERLERVKETLADTKAKIKDLEEQLGQCTGDDKDEQKARIKGDIEHQQKLAEYLTSRIARMES
ncbi:MAG: mechanosensitive ion channel family protein [Phycisphaerales bacterium]|nr:mechanosensitive ion channel family protein [Phycisphaerales bacterium]